MLRLLGFVTAVFLGSLAAEQMLPASFTQLAGQWVQQKRAELMTWASLQTQIELHRESQPPTPSINEPSPPVNGLAPEAPVLSVAHVEPAVQRSVPLSAPFSSALAAQGYASFLQAKTAIPIEVAKVNGRFQVLLQVSDEANLATAQADLAGLALFKRNEE